MKIGLYIVLSLFLVIATAIGVYMINPGTYSFEVFGINMPMLPIAIWVALPVALLAIVSILHMIFYSTKNFFSVRKLRGDAKKLEDGIYWSLIQEPSSVNYANDDMKKSASILSEAYITPVSLDNTNISDKLRDTAKAIMAINSGEYVDLKNQKFAKHLTDNNKLKLKNDFNRLDKEPEFAIKVIDFKDKYNDAIIEEALDKIVENEDFYKLKKYAKDLGKERFFKLLNRVENGEDIGFSVDMLKSFVAEYDLDCKDYYKVAKVALKVFEPDENLNLFKELVENNEDAMPSYLYLLFKYEMLDKVKEKLEESSEDEYKALRAFYALKKSKYNYKIDEVITADNLCK
jgi:hypothetical protein